MKQHNRRLFYQHRVMQEQGNIKELKTGK